MGDFYAEFALKRESKAFSYKDIAALLDKEYEAVRKNFERQSFTKLEKQEIGFKYGFEGYGNPELQGKRYEFSSVDALISWVVGNDSILMDHPVFRLYIKSKLDAVDKKRLNDDIEALRKMMEL